MFRDDWSIDPLALICVGLTSWFSYKRGAKYALDQLQKESELEMLRREVASLKAQVENKPYN